MRGVIDTVITAPTSLAVSLTTAKLHLRTLGDDEDTLIEGWIASATSFFEEQTGRQLITATRELWMDRFPTYRQAIELPKPPMQSVVSVQYVASDGTLTPFSDGASPETPYYEVKAPAGDYSARGWIAPSYGLSWPTARHETGAVRIQYICGYGDDEESIPALAKSVILWLVAHFDQNRSAVDSVAFSELPMGVQKMIEGFKYSAYPRLTDPMTGGWR